MRVFLLVTIMMIANHTHAQMTFNCSPITDKTVKSLRLSFRSQFEGITTIVRANSTMEVWPMHLAKSENGHKNYHSSKLKFKISDKFLNFEQDDFELNGFYGTRKIQFNCYSRGQVSDL